MPFANLRCMTEIDITSHGNHSVVEEIRGGHHAITEDASETYGEAYFNAYRTGHGLIVYDHSPNWLIFFATLADEIIRVFRPSTVLDAGCALGLLVESLWDRAVRAQGIDISQYAISHVRPDMRPYCRVASLTEPIEGSFDLVTCIEVLEHLTPADAEIAIANLCHVTDTILFSSTPTDFDEPTHVNVNPPIAWIGLFAAHGFGPDFFIDGAVLPAHTMIFRRGNPCDVAFQRAYALISRYRVLSSDRFEALAIERKTTATLRETEQQVRSELAVRAQLAAEAQARVQELEQQLQAQSAVEAELRAVVQRQAEAEASLAAQLETSRAAQGQADQRVQELERQFEVQAAVEAELRALAQATLEAQVFAENRAAVEAQQHAEAKASLEARLEAIRIAHQQADARANLQTQLRSEALATLAAETKRYQAKLHELHDLILDMRASESWRLTYPLRITAKGVRKIANRLLRRD